MIPRKTRKHNASAKSAPPFFPTLIGTGFGAGFWPWGPGTAGALLATLIWIGASYIFTPLYLLIFTLVTILLFTFLGIWAADRLEPFWGEDPSRVVVDEMVGVWIPLLIAAPYTWWHPWIAFLLFRFFDIVKPLGVRKMENLPGGIGVMADDILAGVYSAIILFILKLL